MPIDTGSTPRVLIIHRITSAAEAASFTTRGVMDFQHARAALSSGLLSFPITDFATDGSFDAKSYRARLEWLMPYGASALFAAGGTGEGFSLNVTEHYNVVRTAVETCGDHTPIIGSAGYGTALAIEMAQNSEKAGAAAILLLPHYLTEASQAGIVEHVKAVCRAVKIGVILYNRNVCRLDADSVARIAEACPNFIGFKDGIGDIELMVGVRSALGDRLTYLGGLPRPKSMPRRTARWACRSIRRPCSTSFRAPRWISTPRSSTATRRRRTG